MTNFVSDRLFVIDPMGERSELMNDEFKYGIVFYNRNCKSSFGAQTDDDPFLQ